MNVLKSSLEWNSIPIYLSSLVDWRGVVERGWLYVSHRFVHAAPFVQMACTCTLHSSKWSFAGKRAYHLHECACAHSPVTCAAQF